jgi:hypothetical protein
MFSEQYIDNDIAIVDSAIREYYGLQAEVKKNANSLV